MIGLTVSHYKILEKLGEGGMGDVFLAEDTKLERKVALKFLPAKTSLDKDARKRFEREAKAAAALNHPNIVTIYEIADIDNRIYIAMEYVEGVTLKEKITCPGKHPAAPPGEETPPPATIPLEEIIAIASQVCDGLEEAHKAGIIHRDIKLQNIILDKKNRLKILDFGLAKLKGTSKITGDLSRVGTVYYMSPEQAQGEEVDLRTDIWSLGVVLYELATGRPPFKGEHEQAVIHSIINDSPQPPTEIRGDLPKGMEKIIMKCLRKNREDRYPSALALASELKELGKSLQEEKQDALTEQEEKPGTAKEIERRQATVISAEIMGYRRILKKFDVEEAAAVMGTCFKIFGAIVEKYGGVIDRIMGTGLTALFGVPTAVEDAPKKAVNAAIEMRNHLYEFNLRQNPPTALDIRAGINTGMVIAGAVGPDNKSDFSVIGDTVTVAAQLKDLSGKGKIYVGPLTYRYTRDEFEYKELKIITLKGKTKATTVFKLLSSREKIYRPGFEPGRMIHSEMVGRDKELDKLKLHLLKAINGEGSIVSIIGDAGIGKSRLTAELKNSADIEKVTLFEGRALSIGKNLNYHPFIDILENWAGLKEEKNETDSLSRLERAIAGTCPGNAADIFPCAATMMGMTLTGKHAERMAGLDGKALEKFILKNMRELIIKSAEQHPPVLIIEDLQWADIASIELLESLFPLAEDHPILFINVLRPNDKETGDRIVDTADIRHHRIHTRIHLEPLPEKECETLIRSLVKVDRVPPNTMTAIIQRTEGNPSFIEEVARSLPDEGAVTLKDGKFNLDEKIEAVTIPKTIRDVQMTKIDGLAEPTKTLLKEASVIGRNFFYRILVQVTATETTGDIDEKLQYLKDSRIIGERTRAGEREYFFTHAITQETAYESILLKKRKELHLEVAAAIETVFPDRLPEFYGILALHFSQGDNPAKAGEYLQKAGEESLKATASGEALTNFNDALEYYLKKYPGCTDPEKIAVLEKNIACAFYNKGHMSEAVKHFDRVLEIWGERTAKNKFTALLYFLLDLLRVIKTLYFPSRQAKLIPTERDNDIFEVAYRRGAALVFIDPRRMVRDSIRLLRNHRKYDPARVRGGVTLWASVSGIFFFSGISFNIAGKLLDYARNYLNPGAWKDAFTYDLFECAYRFLAGNWDMEPRLDKNAVAKSLEDGDLYTAPLHLLLNGVLAVEKGQFAAVREYIDRLQEIGTVYENDFVLVLKYLLDVRLLLQRRKLFEALREVDAGIALSGKVGQDIFLLNFYGFKANIQVLQGDIGAAAESLGQVKQLLSREKRVTPAHISSYRLSCFLFHVYSLGKNIREGDKLNIMQSWEDARRSGKAAVKTIAKCAIYRTETFRLMGVYYWLTGRQKKALAWWGKSIAAGQRLGAAAELARTYREVGQRLPEKKSKFHQWNGITAPEFLEKARRLFENMELEQDLLLMEKENV